VQQQIEARAKEIWRGEGCCDGAALSHWLQAEREVLEQFVLDYDARQSARREASRRPTAQLKGPSPKALILGQRPTNKLEKRVATTIPL